MAEDDPLVRTALVRMLDDAGYRVLAAADGREAVKIFADNRQDVSLVVLDMIMPEMNGREAHSRIAQISPDIPVIYCTGYDPTQEQTDAEEMIGGRIVEKPIDPQILLATIRELLDRKTACPVT